jgi:hypothetical protein
MNPTQSQQLAQYLPWIQLIGIPLLFLMLRFTRHGLRRRVDEIGYRMMGQKGLLLWFWLNAPGVMLHELSHACAILLFYPFGFRITSVTLFHIQAKQPPRPQSRAMRQSNDIRLQLGEVQYRRPPRRAITVIGDGLSGIAPLFGGIVMFLLLYWVATGYALWDYLSPSIAATHPLLGIFRPGWPWWTLLFAPYLILTITSELWPSRTDWRGARTLVLALLVLALIALGIALYVRLLVLNDALILALANLAKYIDLAFAALLVLDLVFLFIAEGIVQWMRR